MRIISMMNHKGGVGKTTSVATMGVILAKKNKKVLVIDLDFQENLTYIFQDDRDFSDCNIASFFAEEKTLEEVIHSTRIKNLDIIPASSELSEQEPPEKLSFSKYDYDYVFFDTPPYISDLTLMALLSSSDVLIPFEISMLAVKGISKMRESINVAREYNEKLKVLGIFPSRVNKIHVANNIVKSELPTDFPFISVDIPVSADVNNAYLIGETVYEYKKSGKVTKAYIELIKEVFDE